MSNQVTLQEIIESVRELTFDRFVIPAFAIKAKSGYNLSITPTKGAVIGSLQIKEETEEGSIVEYSFSDYTTMEELMAALIESEIVVAYTPYFKGVESVESLLKVTGKSLSSDVTVFRRYFFSDAEIKDKISWYYYKVLSLSNVVPTDDIVARLVRPSEQHMAIWVSYALTDKRRLYESAATVIGQSFTDGSDYVGSSMSGAPISTSLSIGSVFSISENATEGYFQEDFNRVGSDNVLGDRYSFWYKLMLYLRGLLEESFGDYSLRKNNVIPGYVSLQRELDFRSYYDSYPFTLSPLSRGIVSKTP